jgi:hypothetical protein
MRNTINVLLMASCVLLAAGEVSAKDKGIGVGVSIGGDQGINAGIGLGVKDGLNADVDVSVGNKKGIDANVDVDVGSRNGINGDVDVSIGGDEGVTADIDTSIGNDDGVEATVDVGLGRPEDDNIRPGSDVTDGDGNKKPGNVLTTAQRQALNAMSNGEKVALMKRCNSVSSGGYDPALVNLCKLLRMSASR